MREREHDGQRWTSERVFSILHRVVRPPIRSQVPWRLGFGPVLAVALLSALALAGCGSPDLTASYELSGFVSERFESGVTLSPIGGAAVTFRSDTGLVASTTTSSDGRYRMIVETDTPFGQVTAEAAGFAPSTLTVFFDTPVRRIDLDLRRPAP